MRANGKDFVPSPVADTTLRQMLAIETDVMKTREEFENVFEYEGTDICVFVYSSEMENEYQQAVVKAFERTAIFFNEKEIDTLRFLSYDLNLLGPSGRIKLDVPAMYLSPAFKRDDKFKYFMGDPKMEEMIEYIVKHSDIEIVAKVHKNIEQQMQMREMMKEQQDAPNVMDEVERILKERGEL